MKMFYSGKTGGFYDPDFRGQIPADAVEITSERHTELLAGQSSGRVISASSNGHPTLTDRLAPSIAIQSEYARKVRNSRLSSCDWTMLADAPLTVPQKEAWQSYRQSLRDVPDQVGFPQNIVWPSSP